LVPKYGQLIQGLTSQPGLVDALKLRMAWL
jgi:hypothetical protein